MNEWLIEIYYANRAEKWIIALEIWFYKVSKHSDMHPRTIEQCLTGMGALRATFRPERLRLRNIVNNDILPIELT